MIILALTLLSRLSNAIPTVLTSTNLSDGKNIKIDLKNGKTKVFVFMSATCPCSESHEKMLRDLALEFKEVSFVAVHSNANENAVQSKKHFQKANLPFEVLQDSDSKIADEFGALKTPHAFIVNGGGEIVYSGGVTNSVNAPNASRQYLKEALLSLRAGKNPDPREIRTLGCVIARP